MITINVSREPVEASLSGTFASVKLTLRRMTSADFGEAGTASLALLADADRLEAVMTANDVMPDGGVEAWRALAISDPQAYCAVLTGVGEWIAGVECAARAITAWCGLSDDMGVAVPVSRAALESAILNEDFAGQVRAAIDKAAMLIVPVPGAEDAI